MPHDPSHIAMCYKDYYVNGYKFHTLELEENCLTMNNGVYIKGSCYNDYDHDFYGLLVDIVNSEYEKINMFVEVEHSEDDDDDEGVKRQQEEIEMDVEKDDDNESDDPEDESDENEFACSDDD
ncbi:PREDICTED: prostatic spermine-binding protein-like [Theobroma cacao]|uniref:Prostatic spermine-binding protein-like n=1 Tax=Theobroma cacao TaxID=3641 RepID=A0AB32VT42_THECC|nr:PREDICTED: prostatic spermine-binding protein-like [Theobroma cacao]